MGITVCLQSTRNAKQHKRQMCIRRQTFGASQAHGHTYNTWEQFKRNWTQLGALLNARKPVTLLLHLHGGRPFRARFPLSWLLLRRQSRPPAVFPRRDTSPPRRTCLSAVDMMTTTDVRPLIHVLPFPSVLSVVTIRVLVSICCIFYVTSLSTFLIPVL